MKITVDQVELVAALSKAQSAVSSKNTITLLNNVYLKAEGETLTVSATDLELTITAQVSATIEEAGTTTLPAKKLLSIVRQLPHAPVTLETDENQVSSISCLQSFFKIAGLSDLEYPVEGEIEDYRELTLNNVQFKKMMEKISYSVSNDETRHSLNGILLSIREGTFTTVATDGRRLALVESFLDLDASLDGDVILPIKAVNELQKLLSNEGEVLIKLGEARAEFTIADTTLRSKLIDGSFPNFRQVIPQNFTQQIEIPRVALSDALHRVTLVLSDASGAVKMNMTQSEVVVSAKSDTDESSEPVSVDFIGDATDISLNPIFISEPLRKLDCDNITIRFNDRISPIGIFGDEGFLYIIMPMRS